MPDKTEYLIKRTDGINYWYLDVTVTISGHDTYLCFVRDKLKEILDKIRELESIDSIESIEGEKEDEEKKKSS